MVAKILEYEGVDCIDVSVGVSASGHFIIAPPSVSQGFLLPLAAQIKGAVSIPVIAVGRITDPLLAEMAIRQGSADLIAFGRASIADPDLPNKLLEGRFDEICPCIGCLECTRSFPLPDRPLSKEPISCTMNPFTGKERELEIKPADRKKRVVVIGAGPAGLEASWILAKRGHQVILYEKDEVPGGQFRLAAVPPFKQEISQAVCWLKKMCEKHGVELKFGCEPKAEEIISLDPDAVVVATGAVPLRPNIKGIEGKTVIFFDEILRGKRFPGKRVIIIGGGRVGLELADFLGERGHSVTIVEALPEVGEGIPFQVRHFLFQRLEAYKVRIETSAKVIEILKDGVVFEKEGVRGELRGFDSIVIALGVQPKRDLVKELEGRVGELLVIGDARSPRTAKEAIEEAARVATAL